MPKSLKFTQQYEMQKYDYFTDLKNFIFATAVIC